MRQRIEPVFWLTVTCPRCEHSHAMIYKPDLLDGPIECQCESRDNPHRAACICTQKWDVAISEDGVKELKELLHLAEEQDILYARLEENRSRLGYK